MAKRFTDTSKWDKAWFRKLRPEMKCTWIFLCDRCDHAGVWEIDEGALDFFIGWPVSLREIEAVFGDKIEVVGTKILLKSFADFQYGELNPDNRVHKSVLNRLEKLAPNKVLISPLKGAKDKDKEKDKDKDKDKEKEKRVVFENADQFIAAIPLLFRDKWSMAYPDPRWLTEQYQLCFDFHSADPAQCPRTTGQWMRKLVSWLALGWPKRQVAAPQLSHEDLEKIMNEVRT